MPETGCYSGSADGEALATLAVGLFVLTSSLQIERLKYIHSKGLIHCDIQPGNFTVSANENNEIDVHIIDFAFVKKWTEIRSRERFEGTMYFASANALDGLVGELLHSQVNRLLLRQVSDLSRRDDLESLAYVLITLLRPDSLPWHYLLLTEESQSLPPQEAAELLISLKSTVVPQIFCEGLPDPFTALLVHARTLNFYENPNYDEFIEKFRQLAMNCKPTRYASLIASPDVSHTAV